MLAASDLAGGLLDRLAEARVQCSVARIHTGRGLLDEAQSVDDLGRHPLARAEREILDRSLGLRAPISVARDLDLAERIAFRTDAASRHVIPARERVVGNPRRGGATISCG